jgi:hypothetical protein
MLMSGLLLVSMAHPALAAEQAGEPGKSVAEERAAARSSLPKDMLTECIQNAVAAAVFGGPVGISPYVMGMLGCGIGGLSAIVATGMVTSWEEPQVIIQPIQAAWNALPGFNGGSVAGGVLTAPLVALASVSDVAGLLFSPVLGQPEPPAVMVAERKATPSDAAVVETLMAGHFQPGIGTGWRPTEP